MIARVLAQMLRGRYWPSSTEACLQTALWHYLSDLDAEVDREVRLAPGERIDFMVDDIGIEAKVKCGRRAIYRQLQRYAEKDRINALILITGTALGLPPTINGKPVFYVSLGRASL